MALPAVALAAAFALELGHRGIGMALSRLAIASAGAVAVVVMGRLAAWVRSWSSCAVHAEVEAADADTRSMRGATVHVPVLHDVPAIDGNAAVLAELRRTLCRHQRRGAAFAVLLIEIDAPVGADARRLQAEASVTRHLRAVLRETDVALRPRAGRFAVLLPDVGPPDTVLAVGRRLRQSIAASRWCAAPDIGFRLAAVSYPQQGTDAATLVDAAETALAAAVPSNGPLPEMRRVA